MHKFIILPSCLLVGNLFQEIISYKAEMAGNPYWRTAVIILGYFVVSAIGAFIAAPIAESVLKQIYTHSRKQGLIWEAFFLLAVCAGVFFLYFMVYIHGVVSVLPRSWQNPLISPKL